MTAAPADLSAFRLRALQLTGLVGGALGIAPDASHLAGGGYHVGVADIAKIGKYHGPATAHIGSSTEDYSVRQARDRRGGTNASSAVDIGDSWRAGRAVWLRFNALLYAEMRDHPERLPALRAINICLDGRTKQRYDQLHRGDGLIPSKDTVDSHTHAEFFRDTEGQRGPTLDRLLQLMQAAIGGTTPAPAATEDDMANTWTQPLTQGAPGYAGQQRDTALAFAWMAAGQAAANSDQILAVVKAIAGKVDLDPAELAAIEAAAKVGAGEAFAEQRDAFVAQLVAALPQDKDGNLSVTDVESAIRAVFADAGTP